MSFIISEYLVCTSNREVSTVVRRVRPLAKDAVARHAGEINVR